MKKISYIMCVILVIIALSSCSSKKEDIKNNSNNSSALTSSQIAENQGHIFSLPYFADDSFNPFSAKQSVNFDLAMLLYDPLYSLDNDFEPVPIIAENAVFEENTCKVKIKNNVKFSDGSKLKADDVVKSIMQAKKSAYYSSRLSDVSSVKAEKETVIFKLTSSNRNFLKNLTVPIIKSGSKENGALGTGRYKLAEENNIPRLEKNEFSIRKISNDVKSISLTEIHKYSTLPYKVKIGSVNFVYAGFNLDLKTAEAKNSQVLTNNMTFVGINSANKHLANKDFRKAVSLIINRKAILSDVYANAGYITASPFHPKAKSYKPNEFEISLNDVKAASELLKIAGYTEKNKDGFFELEEEKTELRLLVNSSNKLRFKAAEIIKLNLESCGIAVKIVSEKTDKYREKIASGDYDLYLGEIKLKPDNDISVFLKDDKINRCDDGGETYTAYNKYLTEEILTDDFLRTFDLNTPFIPVMYRNGLSVFSGTLKGNGIVTEYDVFSDTEKWKF